MNFQSSIVNFPLMKSVPIELSILNDISHNPIKFNNITNIFIVFPAVLSCCFGMEAQHAAPLLTFLKLNGIYIFRVIREIHTNWILNSPFSIDEILNSQRFPFIHGTCLYSHFPCNPWNPCLIMWNLCQLNSQFSTVSMYPWYLPGDCRGAALLRLITTFHTTQ